MSAITGKVAVCSRDEAAFDFIPTQNFEHSDASQYIKGYRYRVPKNDTNLTILAKLWVGAGLIEIEEPSDGNYACN